ncbi:nucleotide-binding oligomerization domain-containing protein 1 isoform X1 [Triplophysa rosa]|uniref:Nucleotide binding and oligomerization domain 1 protein n=1 Tax=Triplophysa rosa TaxID=992332 RepID=A0A9W7WR25_TRIRA|nr:nucleotide-binding oligomerization domain-containing protein 1 isoform X1 [Triplophysa rosa]KAI7806822.1 nucleotide binding and oligomerization domain 1 protein [Triplophysa rosa]
MDSCKGSPVSFVKLLRIHRELLVGQVKNTQCLLDNLHVNNFICTEDREIIQRSTTKTDQVRRILELVQSKGEECSAYLVHVLHEAYDAYIDLRPWFCDIHYSPLESIRVVPVINTDPISRYCEKLRCELGRDTQFIMSYSRSEDTRLEDLYTDTQMELLNDTGESLGFLQSLNHLLGDQGVFNQQAETIFITGDAGVGKSILLQKLQNLWSRRELNTRAKFFFKFRCRMFSAFKETDEISLKELIFKHNCYPDIDPDDEVFTYILRFPETVLFTFDGYDEIQMDFDLDNVPEVVSPEEKTHPLLLLMNLLCGKLLRGSRKVLTARTGTEVQRRVIRKKVCLRGFSPEHLRTYTALHFPETEHMKLVSVQLDANPHLCGLCSIPLFSWIILKSFRHFLSVYDTFQLPDSCITLTNVFLLLSEVFLGRTTARPGLLKRSTRCPADTFKSGEAKLWAFARLALQGLERGGFVFGVEEVTSCGLDEKDLQFGFLRPVSHYDACGGSATFEFLHVTLQAFLAAFCLVLDANITADAILRFFSRCEYKHKSRLSCFSCLGRSRPRERDPFQTNEHFQFANLFLCGLLSKPNAALLEHLVPPLSLKKKRKTLKSYLSNSVRTHLKGLPRYPSTDIQGYKVHAMPNFMWMLRCIFETNSEEVAEMTANGISADYIKIAFCNIYSADCSALNFVLHHRKKHLGVDMDNNNISDYGVKQLTHSFSKMTVVRLCVNQLTDSSVEVLAKELITHKVIKVLGLYKNHITDVGAKLIAEIIEECPHLRTVKLGCNNITSLGGTHLARAIHKSKSIFDVGMWGNSIGDGGADAFAEALKNHTSLTNLSLSANDITSRGGRSLAKALKENTSLHIFWLIQNQICDDAASDLADAFRWNSALTHVMLIENELTVHGARQLSDALSINTTLKEVNVKGNRISEAEEKLFQAEKRLRFR